MDEEGRGAFRILFRCVVYKVFELVSGEMSFENSAPFLSLLCSIVIIVNTK